MSMLSLTKAQARLKGSLRNSDDLSTDSILWWVISTYRRCRREYPYLFQQEQFAHLEVIELKTPSETEALVSTYALKPQPRSNGNV